MQPAVSLAWEEVLATYHTQAIAKPLQFRRVSVFDDRRIYEDQDGQRYLSLTSFVGAVLPESYSLKSWREKMIESLGIAETRAYVQATANYGTALHILIGDFAKEKSLDMLSLTTKAESLLEGQGFSPRASYFRWAVLDLLDDFAALAQFLYDTSAEVLAVELPVGCPTLKLATQIDLVAWCKIKRERHLCCINWKSGRSNGRYDSHAMQLSLEAELFERSYGALGYKVDKILNVTPKDWRTSPTYNLIDHTAQREATLTRALHLHQAAPESLFNFERTELNILAGTLNLGDNPADFFKKIKA